MLCCDHMAKSGRLKTSKHSRLPWRINEIAPDFKLIDAWALASTGTDEFRWSQAIDSDLAEFLLHGLERCFHSSAVQAQVTSDEYRVYRPFTLHILQAFVDGLRAEGGTHAEYVEQIKALLGDSLD